MANGKSRILISVTQKSKTFGWCKTEHTKLDMKLMAGLRLRSPRGLLPYRVYHLEV